MVNSCSYEKRVKGTDKCGYTIEKMFQNNFINGIRLHQTSSCGAQCAVHTASHIKEVCVCVCFYNVSTALAILLSEHLQLCLTAGVYDLNFIYAAIVGSGHSWLQIAICCHRHCYYFSTVFSIFFFISTVISLSLFRTYKTWWLFFFRLQNHFIISISISIDECRFECAEREMLSTRFSSTNDTTVKNENENYQMKTFKY